MAFNSKYSVRNIEMELEHDCLIIKNSFHSRENKAKKQNMKSWENSKQSNGQSSRINLVRKDLFGNGNDSGEEIIVVKEDTSEVKKFEKRSFIPSPSKTVVESGSSDEVLSESKESSVFKSSRKRKVINYRTMSGLVTKRRRIETESVQHVEENKRRGKLVTEGGQHVEKNNRRGRAPTQCVQHVEENKRCGKTPTESVQHVEENKRRGRTLTESGHMENNKRLGRSLKKNEVTNAVKINIRGRRAKTKIKIEEITELPKNSDVGGEQHSAKIGKRKNSTKVDKRKKIVAKNFSKSGMKLKENMEILKKCEVSQKFTSSQRLSSRLVETVKPSEKPAGQSEPSDQNMSARLNSLPEDKVPRINKNKTHLNSLPKGKVPKINKDKTRLNSLPQDKVPKVKKDKQKSTEIGKVQKSTVAISKRKKAKLARARLFKALNERWRKLNEDNIDNVTSSDEDRPPINGFEQVKVEQAKVKTSNVSNMLSDEELSVKFWKQCNPDETDDGVIDRGVLLKMRRAMCNINEQDLTNEGVMDYLVEECGQTYVDNQQAKLIRINSINCEMEMTEEEEENVEDEMEEQLKKVGKCDKREIPKQNLEETKNETDEQIINESVQEIEKMSEGLKIGQEIGTSNEVELKENDNNDTNKEPVRNMYNEEKSASKIDNNELIESGVESFEQESDAHSSEKDSSCNESSNLCTGIKRSALTPDSGLYSFQCSKSMDDDKSLNATEKTNKLIDNSNPDGLDNDTNGFDTLHRRNNIRNSSSNSDSMANLSQTSVNIKNSSQTSDITRNSSQPSDNIKKFSQTSDNVKNSSQTSDNTRNTSQPSDNIKNSSQTYDNVKNSSQTSDNTRNTSGSNTDVVILQQPKKLGRVREIVDIKNSSDEEEQTVFEDLPEEDSGFPVPDNVCLFSDEERVDYKDRFFELLGLYNVKNGIIAPKSGLPLSQRLRSNNRFNRKPASKVIPYLKTLKKEQLRRSNRERRPKVKILLDYLPSSRTKKQMKTSKVKNAKEIDKDVDKKEINKPKLLEIKKRKRKKKVITIPSFLDCSEIWGDDEDDLDLIQTVDDSGTKFNSVHLVDGTYSGSVDPPALLPVQSPSESNDLMEPPVLERMPLPTMVRCPKCGKLIESTVYNLHELIHGGQNSCDVCGKRFSHTSDLYRHRMIHNDLRPHECQICYKSFTQIGNLKRHQQRVHKLPISNKLASKKETKDCNNVETELKENNAETSEKIEEEKKVEPAAAVPQTFLCHFCNKLFKVRFNYAMHMLMVHKHTVVPKYHNPSFLGDIMSPSLIQEVLTAKL